MKRQYVFNFPGLMHSLIVISPDVQCFLVRFKAFMWPRVWEINWSFPWAEVHSIKISPLFAHKNFLTFYSGKVSVTSCAQKGWAIYWCVVNSLLYQWVFSFHLLFSDDHSNPERTLFCTQVILFFWTLQSETIIKPEWQSLFASKTQVSRWLSKWQRAWSLTKF